MKILARHLTRHMLSPLLYLLLTFSLLFIIADLTNHGEDFYRYNLSLRTVATYYSWQLPSMVVITIPICLLLATLYSLSQLTRSSEITAMRASGISLTTLLQPYLTIAIAALLLTTFINEWLSPQYSYQAHQLIQQKKESTSPPRTEPIAYRNPTLGHTWTIEKIDPRTYTLYDITLRQQRPDGTDKQKITAAKAYWLDQHWWFEDGTLQLFNQQSNLMGTPQPFQIREMRDLPESPEDFLGESKDPAHLSALELRHYIQNHLFLSSKTLAGYRVDFHHKLATPFVCLLAVLLGIPIGNHTGRRGSLSGILLALSLFFGYYATQFTTQYLARKELISPMLGSWFPLALFLLIALLMIRKMR
ncbi:MAG: hypothetical protein CBE26_00605 [Kiritimatiellaceae bacterium TMED266]|nr:MAG: hypothetical protein CBE26_00605 [Kiritimatiellaceae bacterium TMED266]